MFNRKQKKSLYFRFVVSAVNVCFIASFISPAKVMAQSPADLGLPKPGTMISLTENYVPLMVKGLRVHPENPILFDFIVDTGNSGLSSGNAQLKTESEKLIKYFLASLTIPEEDLWVNLSPYEKDRIIPNQLGQTDMGRDMLAQDYILKQLTASLIYPEKELGKEFWNKVYAKAQALYGSSDIPVNTFNKVWIVADKAKVYVHNNTAFVVGSHLKVMLEEDYLAAQKHIVGAQHAVPVQGKIVNQLGSQIVREIVLPELEREVNQGKTFGNLRQIFHSMILATWYKKNLKEALLNQVYSNKAKINGVDTSDKTIKEQIYQEYLKAYKKGVFNYIKEDLQNGQVTPRKYFSGGVLGKIDLDQTENPADSDVRTFGREGFVGPTFDVGVTTPKASDLAMVGVVNFEGLKLNKGFRPTEKTPFQTTQSLALKIFTILKDRGFIKENRVTSKYLPNVTRISALLGEENRELWGYSKDIYWTLDFYQRHTDLGDTRIRASRSEELVGSDLAMATTGHDVVLGDTLNRIADQYLTSVEELRAKNPQLRDIPANQPLQVGIRVLVNFDQDALARRGGDRAMTANHIVRAGQSLSQIADKYGMTADALAKLNGLGVDAQLTADQVLDVVPQYPADLEMPKTNLAYYIQENDTLSSIAKKFKVTIADIKKANQQASWVQQFTDETPLPAGEIIMVTHKPSDSYAPDYQLIKQVSPHMFNLFGFGSGNLDSVGSSYEANLRKIIQEGKTRGVITKEEGPGGLSYLPSYLKAPTGQEEGDFIGVDFSGTNLKIVVLRMTAGQEPVVINSYDEKFPGYLKSPKTKVEDIFKFVALKVAPLLKGNSNKSYQVGLSFAFPMTHSSARDANVTDNTKGWDNREIKGKNPGVLLQEALKENEDLQAQGITAEVSAVLNDTVATLLSSPGAVASEIHGTGNNGSIVLEDGSIVNLESGNFNNFRDTRTSVDESVLLGSSPEGRQHFEKMVSGKYLIQLFEEQVRRFSNGTRTPGLFGMLKYSPWKNVQSDLLAKIVGAKSTSEVSDVINQEDFGYRVSVNLSELEAKTLQRISWGLLNRAGALVAEKIGRELKIIDEYSKQPQYKIVIDGSVFWQNPIVQIAFKDQMKRMGFGEDRLVIAKFNKYTSAFGAAVAAAVASQGVNPNAARSTDGKVSVVKLARGPILVRVNSIEARFTQAPKSAANLRELANRIAAQLPTDQPISQALIERVVEKISGSDLAMTSRPDKNLEGILATKLAAVQNQIQPLLDAYQKAKQAGNKDEQKRLEDQLNQIVDKQNVYSQSDIDHLGLSDDVEPLANFVAGETVNTYRQKAKEVLLKGNYVPQFIFAGAATRLNRGPMYHLDIWDIAKEMNKAKDEDSIAGLGMGPRQILAYQMALEKLAKESGLPISQVMASQRIVVNVNEDIESQVLADFIDNNFYGFNPENVFFIVQPTFKGFKFGTQGLEFADQSNAVPYGHGHNFMQLAQGHAAFTLSKDGQREYIEEPIINHFGDDTLIGSHRINDLTKLSESSVISVDKLAWSMAKIDQGFDVAGELVDNPGKQKGGNVLKDKTTGKSFLIETSNVKGDARLIALLDEAGKQGAPYNAFRLVYKTGSLKRILQSPLPFNLRFKEGHFYLEAVTGDVTQMLQTKAVFMNSGEIIHDFKEPKNIEDGLSYLRKSDQELFSHVQEAVTQWEKEKGWDKSVAKNVVAWYSSKSVNDRQRAALLRLIREGKVEEIQKGFESEIGFLKPGTAGTRQKMENFAEGLIGPNFFSETTVLQYTSAFVKWYKETNQTGPAFITKEVRDNSDTYGDLAAQLLVANGIPVVRLTVPVSTPFASYLAKWMAKSRFGTSAFGYQISASHNAYIENGIKFMGPAGQQFMKDMMDSIVSRVPSLSNVGQAPNITLKGNSLYHEINSVELDEIRQQYFEAIDETMDGDFKTLVNEYFVKGGQKFVFSPLNGASTEETVQYLKRLGLEEGINYFIPAQEKLMPRELPEDVYKMKKDDNSDPARKGVLDVAKKFAEEKGINMIMARDPDGDRFVIAIKINGEWKQLDGNQNAIVMAHDRLSHAPADQRKNMLVMRSHATTSLLDRIAVDHGVEMIVVPVGYKYLGAMIMKRYPNGVGRNYIGLEESYGTGNGHINEKDGLSGLANMMLILARQSKGQKTVFDYLNDIYVQYGYPGDDTVSIKLPGEGKPQHDKARSNVLKALKQLKVGDSFAGFEIVSYKSAVAVPDLLAEQIEDGFDLTLKDSQSNKEFRLLFRASGTEPIFKGVFSWIEPLKSQTQQDLEARMEETTTYVKGTVDPRIREAFAKMATTETVGTTVAPVDDWEQDETPVQQAGSQEINGVLIDSKTFSLGDNVQIENLTGEQVELAVFSERIKDHYKHRRSQQDLTESIRLENIKLTFHGQGNHQTIGITDQAMAGADLLKKAPGGIDLNSKNMQMDIDGQKIDIRFDPAMIEQFKAGDFSGVQPVILNITPIADIMPLLGLAPAREEEQLAKI